MVVGGRELDPCLCPVGGAASGCEMPPTQVGGVNLCVGPEWSPHSNLYPATYVGETKRKLCKRMDEHKSTVRMADFNVSAIAEHAWNAGHGVDWNGVTILDQHKNLHPRLALEAFHTQKQPLPLNRDRSSLPPAYNHLLKNSRSLSTL